MILDARNISVTIDGKPILEQVSFATLPNELLCVIGPSGAGKTTLLRCLAGLQTYKGSVYANTTCLDPIPVEQRNVGYVDQQLNLFPHLTVYENVAYPLQVRRMNSGRIAAAVQAILAQFEINHVEQRLPQQLSGGEQQRVAIARACIYEPAFLLLDEPFASLDPMLRYAAVQWLRALLRDRPVTTMFVTHNIQEAQALSDRALFLDCGKKIAFGRWSALEHAPSQTIQHFFTRQY